MRKGHKRADWVPAAPVRRALKQYLHETGRDELAPRSEHRSNDGRHHYSIAIRVLAEKVGVGEDTVYRWAGYARYQNMHFDTADKILTAIERPSLWWQDPELSKVYESACKGADKIHPIAVAA